MSENFTNKMIDLVVAQGTPRHEGFNPIPPRCHRWMMDCSQPETTRVLGWAIWRTEDRDPNGLSGPIKKGRSVYAHDCRAGKRGFLTAIHLAEDLGMTKENARDALRRAAEAKLITLREDGRILPNGHAPLPTRTKDEDAGEGNNGEEPIYFCTEICPELFSLSYQQLPLAVRTQWTRLYRQMPTGFRDHLAHQDKEARAHLTWCYLEGALYCEQVKADAIAAARALERSVLDQVFARAHYSEPETRGRKTREESKRPELAVQLNVRKTPNDISVQKLGAYFVQMDFSDLYRTENGSVQNPHPYFLFQSSSEISQSSRASGNVKKSSAPHLKEGGASGAASSPTPPTTLPSESLPSAIRTQDQKTFLEGVHVPANEVNGDRRRGAMGLRSAGAILGQSPTLDEVRQLNNQVKAETNGHRKHEAGEREGQPASSGAVMSAGGGGQ